MRKRAWRIGRLDSISSNNGDIAGDEGDEDVKILLSAAVLVGSLGLLLTDWAGNAFPYL